MNTVSKADGTAEVVLSAAAECKLSQPIWLSITAQNRGGGAGVVTGDDGHLPDCRLALRDRDAKHPVELTEFGNQEFNPTGGHVQYAEVPLAGGQEKTWKIDLRRILPCAKAISSSMRRSRSAGAIQERRLTIHASDLRINVSE